MDHSTCDPSFKSNVTMVQRKTPLLPNQMIITIQREDITKACIIVITHNGIQRAQDLNQPIFSSFWFQLVSCCELII